MFVPVCLRKKSIETGDKETAFDRYNSKHSLSVLQENKTLFMDDLQYRIREALVKN